MHGHWWQWLAMFAKESLFLLSKKKEEEKKGHLGGVEVEVLLRHLRLQAKEPVGKRIFCNPIWVLILYMSSSIHSLQFCVQDQWQWWEHTFQQRRPPSKASWSVGHHWPRGSEMVTVMLLMMVMLLSHRGHTHHGHQKFWKHKVFAISIETTNCNCHSSARIKSPGVWGSAHTIGQDAWNIGWWGFWNPILWEYDQGWSTWHRGQYQHHSSLCQRFRPLGSLSRQRSCKLFLYLIKSPGNIDCPTKCIAPRKKFSQFPFFWQPDSTLININQH